jgi:hypothetical protein
VSRCPQDRALSVEISASGVLSIKIGVATLAHAALHSDLVQEAVNVGEGASLENLFKIVDLDGFARDVVAELESEDEAGNSPLTRLFDSAFAAAIENGSEHFVEKDTDVG